MDRCLILSGEVVPQSPSGPVLMDVQAIPKGSVELQAVHFSQLGKTHKPGLTPRCLGPTLATTCTLEPLSSFTTFPDDHGAVP